MHYTITQFLITDLLIVTDPLMTPKHLFLLKYSPPPLCHTSCPPHRLVVLGIQIRLDLFT